jgi:hypothetical protein
MNLEVGPVATSAARTSWGCTLIAHVAAANSGLCFAKQNMLQHLQEHAGVANGLNHGVRARGVRAQARGAPSPSIPGSARCRLAERARRESLAHTHVTRPALAKFRSKTFVQVLLPEVPTRSMPPRLFLLGTMVPTQGACYDLVA